MDLLMLDFLGEYVLVHYTKMKLNQPTMPWVSSL